MFIVTHIDVHESLDEDIQFKIDNGLGLWSSKEHIRHATIVYLDRCNNDDFENCTWGDGDSLDRERVRDILTEKFGYEYDNVTV